LIFTAGIPTFGSENEREAVVFLGCFQRYFLHA